jgi:hypothetical protein
LEGNKEGADEGVEVGRGAFSEESDEQSGERVEEGLFGRGGSAQTRLSEVEEGNTY